MAIFLSRRSALSSLLFAGPALAAEPRARRQMIADIRAMAEVAHVRLSPRVLDALAAVPRERFVPEALRARAYANEPLEIGYGQTISQPFVVAAMTELVEAKPGAKILEIGTGSGYQAAVLAALGAEVYTIEIVAPLGRAAAVRLSELGYAVHTRIGDGYEGWPEAAPFDGIVVTAAPDAVPQPLKEQLAVGGRMVVPVGKPQGRQDLLLVRK